MPTSEAGSSSGVETAAHLPLVRLDTLWFQITGLLCNLECTHCLVDSSPQNKSMAFLSRDEVKRYLGEADELGVKEIYFTGGEPFLHREMVDILSDALATAPTTVLTNGTLITPRIASALGELAQEARYSLEIRVSMDHPDPARNDAVRGPGTHAKALRAVLRLQEAKLLPIVTATEYVLDGACVVSVYDAFLQMLREAGVRRPRLKVLPVFHTGKIEDPDSGGPVTEAMVREIDPLFLQCASSRAVTAQGVYACPILVGEPAGRVGGDSLTGALGPVSLSHHACGTCYRTGMTCGNV